VPESSPPRVESQEHCVTLPGECNSTVLEVTEMLKDLIKQNVSNTVGAITYKRSFFGHQVIEVFRGVFEVSEKGAFVLAQQILHLGIFHALLQQAGRSSTPTTFESNALYRLQCHDTPDILNSYRFWTERTDTDSMRLMNRLLTMLQEIEMKVTDEVGNTNFKKAVSLAEFAVFEEAVCELQGVDMNGMDDVTKLVRIHGTNGAFLYRQKCHVHSHRLLPLFSIP
jgi:hypothetical protein